MTVSVSVKGVTHLLQGHYKRRHGGSKEILQQPVSGFIPQKEYYIKRPWEVEKKQKARKKLQPAPPAAVPEKPKKICSRLKAYRIDRKQVTHRILNYINQMSGEKLLYLWTVTFPKGTSDNTAFLLLNKWLTRLRKEKMLKEYLWITERQENKTLHYHIAINNRMDVKKANRFMRAAIMTSIDKKEIEWNRTDAAKYNGVDISKNRKTRRVTNFAKQKNQKALSNYLTKYISKSNDTFQHLAWHNSRGYSNLIISVNLLPSEYHNSTISKQINLDNPIQTDFYVFFRWLNGPPESLMKYLAHCNQKVMILLGIN